MRLRSRRFPLLWAVCLLAVGCCFAQKRTYTNPVIHADFPDPTLLRDNDGLYWAYGTQGGHPGAHIQVAHSADLVHWTQPSDALPVKPAWASQRHNFWAPDVHRFGQTYFMYFAAENNSSAPTQGESGVQGMCLGVATSPTAAGPFTDSGAPLLCATGFADIDPMAFDDPVTGKHLLYWGSGFKPIQVQELAADRLHFKPGTTPTAVMQPIAGGGADNYRRLVEGAWATFHRGWYYLYFSGDNCCGAGAHYAVMVGRSRHAFGPFEVRGNGVILKSSSTWLAPGHNSTVTDGAGKEWMAYHAIDPAHREDGRYLLLDRIVYRGGWPVVGNGEPSAGPSTAPTP